MNEELRAKLESWLLSDDPVQRQHAKFRLSLTDEQAQVMADVVRATRLIAENPPQATDQRCCGG